MKLKYKNYSAIFLLIVSVIFILVFNTQSNKKIEINIKTKNDNSIFPGILAIRGTSLNKYEKILINHINPYGIILFAYNIKSKEQLTKLRNEIELITGRKIIFFVDQEGGRVNRFKKIYSKNVYPAPYKFNNVITKDIEESKKLVYFNAIKVANELKELNIDVNLAPVLDVLNDNTTINEKYAISSKKTKYDIGDRSFSSNPEIVKTLSEEYIRAFHEVGVDICVKHFIGLGSSKTNTHKELAIIDLKEKDLIPFRNLTKVKYGMLAHAIYPSIDSENPATFSKKVVKFIRENLKFDGILISDALNMGALDKYNYTERMEKTLNSGIDLVIILNNPRNETELKNMLSILLPIKQKYSLSI